MGYELTAGYLDVPVWSGRTTETQYSIDDTGYTEITIPAGCTGLQVSTEGGSNFWISPSNTNPGAGEGTGLRLTGGVQPNMYIPLGHSLPSVYAKVQSGTGVKLNVVEFYGTGDGLTAAYRSVPTWNARTVETQYTLNGATSERQTLVLNGESAIGISPAAAGINVYASVVDAVKRGFRVVGNGSGHGFVLIDNNSPPQLYLSHDSGGEAEVNVVSFF